MRTEENRRKARPEAPIPGFFTGLKRNFVTKTLALPFNIAGGLYTRELNRQERAKPEFLGNTQKPDITDKYRAWKETDGYTKTKKGMVPTTHSITPRPPHHSFDLLNGGKGLSHMIQLESTFDLKNLIPHNKFEEHKARIAAKAKNDQKISDAHSSVTSSAYPYEKTPSDPAPSVFGPSSMQRGIPYDPYMRK